MKQHHVIFALFILFNVMVPSGIARAGLYHDEISAGLSIAPKEGPENDIALLEENVNIDIWKDRLESKAVFTLQNTGSNKKELQVGASSSGWFGLKSFSVFINGKKIEISEDKLKPADQILDDETLYWKYWKMTFKPREIQQVEVRYSTVPMFEMDDQKVVALLSGGEAGEIHQKMKVFEVQYAITDGAAWKGPIGKTIITAKLHDMTNGNLSGNIQKNMTVQQDSVQWFFENDEPKNDVVFRVIPNIRIDEITALFERYHQKYPKDPLITRELGSRYRSATGSGFEISDQGAKLFEEFILSVDPLPRMFGDDVSREEKLQADAILRMGTDLVLYYESKSMDKTKLPYVRKISRILTRYLLEAQGKKGWTFSRDERFQLQQDLRFCERVRSELKDPSLEKEDSIEKFERMAAETSNDGSGGSGDVVQ